MLDACHAAIRGGLRVIEITLTTPDALSAIEELSTDTTDLPPIRHLDLRVAPNPFNPSTHVFFSLPGVSDVAFTLFDVAGRRIRSWTLLQQPAGHHALPLNLSQSNQQMSQA